jgi:hypothetical protein
VRWLQGAIAPQRYCVDLGPTAQLPHPPTNPTALLCLGVWMWEGGKGAHSEELLPRSIAILK